VTLSDSLASLPPADAVVSEALVFGRWATVLKFGYNSFKKMFWNFFVMMVRVMDPATVQQAIGIIGGVRRSPPIEDTRKQGVCTMRENKPNLGAVSISRIPANTGKPH